MLLLEGFIIISFGALLIAIKESFFDVKRTIWDAPVHD
jgi:hypothetical protein